ncbi:recombinase RecA [Enterobacter hormaechei]
MYGEGINTYGELIDLGVKHKLVRKQVLGIATMAKKLVKVKLNATNYLKEHPEMYNELNTKLREMLLNHAGRIHKCCGFCR